MEKKFTKFLRGYQTFRNKYARGHRSVMQYLSDYGQQPQMMVVSCCDSRVDPGLILQCDPGDLFVVRNVANIVPPYENDERHHGTSAALEFGLCFLNIKHLILLGHSQCGGVNAMLKNPGKNDFITNWVSIIQNPKPEINDVDYHAKLALNQSYRNCLTFPWIKNKIDKKELNIYLWFFDIQLGKIFTYSESSNDYQPMEENL